MTRVATWLTLCVLGTLAATPELLANSISASPNPCTIPAGSSSCTTTIRWSLTLGEDAKVTVSVNGGPKRDFATSSGKGPHTLVSDPIEAGKTHVYKLYSLWVGPNDPIYLLSVSVTAVNAPAATFSADPTHIDPGGSSTLSWTTSHATSVTIDPGIGSVTPVAGGTYTVTPAETTTYELTATGAGGTVTATATVTINPPTATFSADRTDIDPGESSTLSWTTTNATSVTINPPTVTFGADPTRIDPGESSELSWTTSNADSVSIDQGIGSVAVAGGTLMVSPPATTTYTLTASGAGGTATEAVTVRVTGGPDPPPTIDFFTANPSMIASGDSSRLSWQTNDATSVSISPSPGSGSLPVDGSVWVSPPTTTTYKLTATGVGGTDTASVTVTVTPPPSNSISASPNPCPIPEGQSTCTTTLTWSLREDVTAKIRVSVNGGTETDFSSSSGQGPHHERYGPIEAGKTYVFKLYDYSLATYGNPLDSVQVRAAGAELPTITCSAAPIDTSRGGSSTLSWTTTHATSVSIDSGTGSATPVATNGTYPVTDLRSTRTYRFTAENGRGTAKCLATVTVWDRPTAGIDADPKTIDLGDKSTLEWSSTDAIHVSIDPGFPSVVVSGTREVSPDSTTTYTITASNPAYVGSDAATDRVTITVPEPPQPSGSISASPNPCTIPEGAITCSTTIAWTSEGASEVQVWVSKNGATPDHFATTTSPTDDTYMKVADNIQTSRDHTYTFFLYDYSGGSRGSLLGSVEVTGSAVRIDPGTITASPNPCRIAPGESTCSTTLSWSSDSADSRLWVSHNGAPETPVSRVNPTTVGWIQAAPAHTYTFYLYDYSGGSRGVRLAFVEVTGENAGVNAPTATFTADPTDINLEDSSMLRWETTNATSVSIDPEIGSVTEDEVESGSRLVSPSSTTTYTLTATGPGGTLTPKPTVTVTVAPRASGSISASPDPCTIHGETDGKGSCSTIISWTAGGTSAVEVRVSSNRAKQTCFARSSGGGPYRQVAELGPGRHTFYLYDNSGGSQGPQIDSVDVTVSAEGIASNTITASSDLCTVLPGHVYCTTTVTWSLQDPTDAVVLLGKVDNCGDWEPLYRSSAAGIFWRDYPLIKAGKTYVFTLYDMSSATYGIPLDSVTVTGQASDGLVAEPGSCTDSGD